MSASSEASPRRPVKPSATSRRDALFALPLGVGALLALPSLGRADEDDPTPPEGFPSQDARQVYQVVLDAHTNIESVRTLVQAQPDLAKSAIDWGFGDWESALGAAAHMGRADIAHVLLEHGARPDLFAHAMLGHLDVVRAAVEASPGIQRTLGPHGFTLLFHAKAGGEAAEPVVRYLEALGDADPAQSNEPLPHAKEKYLGRYSYGDGRWFAIEERRGMLRFQRGDDFPRTLFHLGNNEFRPSGSMGVRVRFDFEGDRAVAVSVLDPELIVRGVPL